MKTIITILSLTISLIFLSAATGFADKYDNKRALQNVSAGKVYFDVNIGAGMKLAMRLKLIDATYNQLVSSNVQPDIVIGFRGKATRFVTKGTSYVFEEDLPVKKEIQTWIKHFKQLGIPMEQCLIAVELQKVDPNDILPEIPLVKNGYVSMIGYQVKGYAQVPMD